MFEGGHRVPFIVRWPSQYGKGQVSGQLTSQIDIFATLASIVKTSVPEGAAEDSLDLSAAWKQPESQSARSEHVHNTWEGAYALRQDDWVLIDFPNGEGKGKGKGGIKGVSGMLFNLVDDLGQKKNLYADYPERVTALRTRLAEIVGAENIKNPAR